MAPLPSSPRRSAALLTALVLLLGACGTAEEAAEGGPSTITLASTAAPSGECADVIDASATPTGDGTYTFSATVSSDETGWDKYADAWEVLDEQGVSLGVRELAHPHENEQPFTRTLTGVEVPSTVERVTLRARDSVLGYCGANFELALQPDSSEENSE